MDTPGASAPPTLADQLLQMASGAWLTQMIHVAAELQLADRLAEGERTVEELAAACGAHADSLQRLLRGLASVGLFRESDPQRFGLTPLAELLRSDHPQSLRQFARMLGDEHYLAWHNLLTSVRTGQSAFKSRYGCHVFDFYRQNPQRGEIFDGAMTDFSRRFLQPVLNSYDFSGIQHLVDIGGGQGSLLKAVLRLYPRLRGTLLERPEVVGEVTVDPDLIDRLEVISGDFTQAVPGGADAYLLKHIIHDWDEATCLQILTRIRTAMEAGGRVLLLEQVIAPGNDPSPAKLLDLNMLVMTEGGRERSPAEYALLLGKAGLRLIQIHSTPSPLSVVEAVVAD